MSHNETYATSSDSIQRIRFSNSSMPKQTKRVGGTTSISVFGMRALNDVPFFVIWTDVISAVHWSMTSRSSAGLKGRVESATLHLLCVSSHEAYPTSIMCRPFIGCRTARHGPHQNPSAE